MHDLDTIEGVRLCPTKGRIAYYAADTLTSKLFDTKFRERVKSGDKGAWVGWGK